VKAFILISMLALSACGTSGDGDMLARAMVAGLISGSSSTSSSGTH
jgi:hypothetical protein